MLHDTLIKDALIAVYYKR